MATFYTGASGLGTGPHLDFRVWDVDKGGYINPGAFTNILEVDGKPLTDQFQMTSGYGPRNAPTAGASTMHKGIDYATPEGTPVTIRGGKYLTTFEGPRGGIMSQYAFQRDGKNYEAILLHGSNQNKVLSEAAKTDYDITTLGTDANTSETVGVVESDRPGAKEKAQQYKMVNKTSSDVVEGFGNQFSDMKSDRLGSALRGAQEDIIQKRMDSGETFGKIRKPVT